MIILLGNTLALSLIRNSIELIGFCILFLLLDKPRFSWKKTILGHGLFLAVYIIASTVWILIDMYSFGKFVTLTIFVGAGILFPIMSSDSPAQTIYNLSLQIFVLIFQIELSVWLATHLFGGSPYADIVFRLLYLGAAILIYLRIFRKSYRKIADSLWGPWRGICLISVAGNLFLIYYWTRPVDVMMRSAREQFVFVCIWALLFITHLMMIRTLVFMQGQMQEKQEKELATVSSHLLGQQLSMLEDSVAEARRIRHDMRHHNMQIAQYVQKGCTEELLRYLGEYEEKAEGHGIVTICDNTAADNILNAYLKKAKQHGIAVRFDVTLEKHIGISDIDLVAMLANLMENAIHGCIHSGKPEPFIELYIGRKASKLIIYAKNTAAEDIVFEDGIPKSNYGEGIGISSILYSAAKYGGEYDFQMTDGIFSCQLLLKTSKTAVK